MAEFIIKERGVHLSQNIVGWKYIELVAYKYDEHGKLTITRTCLSVNTRTNTPANLWKNLQTCLESSTMLTWKQGLTST
jgi:glutamate mutase epsilon subunit